jgi:type I restriction enzyme, S subunit
MNAERLLALYERVAEAPDAIARLRRFILDLAVRGKLVPQDPNDEPASELLRRIGKEKARLDRKERIKREPRSHDADAEPMQIPQGWALAPLADLVTVLNGRAYKQNELLSAGTPVLRVGNLFTSNKWYYSTLQLDEEKYCKKGDLIFAWSASFGPFIWDGERVIYHYHIWKLPLHSDADLSKFFLYNFLLQKTRQIKEAGHGISMIHMTKEKMEKIVVSLPPLAEQHRIVAKVDELMALCDRLEAARKDRETKRDRLSAASLARLNTPDPETFQSDARFTLNALPALTTRPDQIKQLRQTILNLAVRGKLVPQDPNDEPASKLLKQIAADKADRAISARDRRATNIRPLVGEELPFPIPSSWIWASFGDISISRDGERIPVSREERSQRAKVYDYYGASGVIDKIDGFLFDKPLLLIGEDGANLINRSTPIAFIARGNYWVNNHAHVLDGLSEGFLQYLELFINSIDLKPYVTGTAQPKMNQAKMNSIPVALPPLAEQHRIVAKVDELTALCDRLEANLTTSDQTRTRLLEATLAEALAPAGDFSNESIQATEKVFHA